MPTSLQTLVILLLSSITLLLMVATAARPPPKRTSFAYIFNVVKPIDLTYQGDAHFPPDSTVLRLTNTDSFGNATLVSIGRVLYSNPITFWDKNSKASFVTTIKFIIKPNVGDKDPPADGLVLFIAPVNSSVDAPGGYFGVFHSSGNNPSIFAVEFDICSNLLWDPSYRHVGIDIESPTSSNVTQVDDAIVGQEVTACINYDATTNLISVHGSAGGKTFQVSYVYDLSTILPQQVQVGISAATGGYAAVHDVISWSFSSNMRMKKA